MTDITELAQSLKAAANKAGADDWQAKKISGDFYVIRKGSYSSQCGYRTYQPIAEIDHKPTRDYVAIANPANILALVESLEKALQRIAELDKDCRVYENNVKNLLERAGSAESSCAEAARILQSGERMALTRAITILLANGMKVEAEPVAVCTVKGGQMCPDGVHELFAAPQPTLVVPEEATPDSIEILASARRRDHAVFQWDEDQRNAAADSWNAFRAAMLQAVNSPVIGIDQATGADRTVEVRYVAPPGYVMLPKEPTKEMIDAGWLHYMASKNPSSKGTYKAMLAAAPQEVNSES
ncbi:TPA: ead/Ea22-like family protein [Klebsiella pneumoniae]|nr:ead/Ea22-like family protein [Klebsiella pneumoniae]